MQRLGEERERGRGPVGVSTQTPDEVIGGTTGTPGVEWSKTGRKIRHVVLQGFTRNTSHLDCHGRLPTSGKH